MSMSSGNWQLSLVWIRLLTFVWSSENHADVLTHVPEEWVQSEQLAVAAVIIVKQTIAPSSIADIHVQAGHPGIR